MEVIDKMKQLTKKFHIWLVLIMLFTLLIVQAPITYSAETNDPGEVLTFLRDVVMLDMAKYNVTLAGTTDIPAYLGGPPVGITGKYILESAESKIDVLFRIRDNTIVSVSLNPLEGSPLFVQPATDALEAAKSFMDSYRAFSQKAYLQPLQDMLNAVTEMEFVTVTSGNTTFTIEQSSVVEDYVLVDWMNGVNGIYNGYNGVTIFFRRDGTFVQFSDTWTRYPVGSADAMSEEEAYNIAKAAVEAYSYTVAGQPISGLVVSDKYAPPVAKLTMEPRGGALYPSWEFLVPLNQSYPPRVWSIQVILWADTGEVSFITPSGYMGGPDPSPGSSPGTSTPAPSESPPPGSSDTLPTEVILFASPFVATIVVAVAALALKKRRM